MAAEKEKAMSPAEYYKKISKEDRKAIVDLDSKSKSMSFIPTGSWVLNRLAGDGSNTDKPGGFPRGRIVEIYGDESSGKTTLGLSACKQAQDLGSIPVYVDFERTFDKNYAKNLGIDLDREKFVLMEPDHFQHGAKMIKDALLMKPALIVVDSVSAMIPKEYLEGAVDEAGRIGLQAQLMSVFLSIISKHIGPPNTCLTFINQMRSVIKGKYERGPSEESSGGKALKYYASIRYKLETQSIERINAISGITGLPEKKAVNLKVKATVTKNKIDKPYLSGPIYIRFGEGFDNVMSVIDLGVNTNRIKKAGPFLKFVDGDQEVFKVQGKEQLRTLLVNDLNIFNRLKDVLASSIVEDVKEKELNEEAAEESDEMDQMLENVSKAYTKKSPKDD